MAYHVNPKIWLAHLPSERRIQERQVMCFKHFNLIFLKYKSLTTVIIICLKSCMSHSK